MNKKLALLKLTTIALTLTTSLTVIAAYDYGPYLQSGSDTRIEISWRTNSNTNSKVCYGTTPSLGTCIDENNSSDDHTVTIENLTPNTKYYYSINGDNGPKTSSKFNFITAPPVGTSTPVRIWAIGDSGVESSAAEDVRDAYIADSSAHTDVMLLLGDNAYSHGEEDDYEDALFDQYADILSQTVLWPVLGNHDEDLGLYKDMFHLPRYAEAGGVASNSEQYYSFNYANIHFIALDSEHASRSSSGSMFTWLKDDLEQVTADWTIAYFHHSTYSKGKHDSDDSSGGEAEDMREKALPILEANGVDLVLMGHDHTYQRSYLINGHYDDSDTFDENKHLIDGSSGHSGYHKPTLGSAPNEGTVYVVTGTASKFSDGPFDFDHPVHYKNLAEVLGSIVVEVNGDTMDVKFIDDDGDTRDYFSIIKGDGNSGGSIDTSIELQVSKSSDDAEERVNTGDVSIDSTDLELVDESGSNSKEQLVGIRFTTAGIPNGATISSANIQFTVDATNSGSSNLTIKGHYSGNSKTFSTSDHDISARTLTSASVSWSPSAWTNIGASDATQKTPSLVSILQELVNKSTWDEDSAVTFIISGDGEREAESYDGDSSSAPILNVTYQ